MEQGSIQHSAPAILRMFPLLWKLLLGVSSCNSFGWAAPTPFNEVLSQEPSLIILTKYLGSNLASKIKRKHLPSDNVNLLWCPGPTRTPWLVWIWSEIGLKSWQNLWSISILDMTVANSNNKWWWWWLCWWC